MPKLSKKEESFIIYKKQKMIDSINDIINNYNLLKKELYNFIKTILVETEETREITRNMKLQMSMQIIKEILVYVKSHRKIASPNANFITQLCNVLY